MADEFAVETGDLRADAATWNGWQTRLKAVGTAVPTVGSDVDPLAFSILPGAQAVRAAYATVAGRLADEIAAGSTTFTGMADKLTEVAELYEAAEDEVLAFVAVADV